MSKNLAANHGGIKQQDLDQQAIKRLAIWYPNGVQKVNFDPDCEINGRRFLQELANFGWEQHPRGETLHLVHPASDAAAENRAN